MLTDLFRFNKYQKREMFHFCRQALKLDCSESYYGTSRQEDSKKIEILNKHSLEQVVFLSSCNCILSQRRGTSYLLLLKVCPRDNQN